MSGFESQILEGLLEGLVAYDAQWRITYVNAAAEGMLGRKRGELLGKTYAEAFPASQGTMFERRYAEVMEKRQPVRFEAWHPTYHRWFEVSVTPGADGGVAAYFRDVTERREMEAHAEEETRSLEMLNRVGATLSAELDLERVVQAVTDAATELSGAAFGAFFYNRKNEAGESYLLFTL